MRIFLILLLLMGCSVTQKKPIIIAHRGASGYLPEHTLASVAMAHGFNVDYIEPDIVLTKDNHPIVLHDIYLDKTTNVEEIYPKRKRNDGRYYAIDFSLKEIKKLKVFERQGEDGNRYPNRFPFDEASFQIPSLVEYIELIQGMNKSRKKNIGIYIEFKNPKFHESEGKDIVGTMMTVLDENGYIWGEENIYIQCFDPRYLKEIRAKYNNRIKLVQLIADNSWAEADIDYDQMMTEEGMKEVATYADAIGPWIYQLLKPDEEKTDYDITELSEWAKEYKLAVHPYTFRVDELPPFVDDSNELLDILFDDLKVDGLFTDFPDIVLEYINKKEYEK